MIASRFRTPALVAALGAASALALAASASPLPAQEAGDVSVDPRFGVVFPVGALDDVADFSVSGGAGIGWRVHRHVAFRGDLRYARLDAETDAGGRPLAPSLDLFHYTVGVEFDFPRPRWQGLPLSFQLALGVGGTSMSGSEQFGDGSQVSFDRSYPTLSTGGKIGARLATNVRAFAAGEIYLIFADKDDTGVLTARVPGAGAFGTGWTVPVTLGIEATFP